MEKLTNIVQDDSALKPKREIPSELDEVLNGRKTYVEGNSKVSKTYEQRPSELSSSPGYTDYAGDSD